MEALFDLPPVASHPARFSIELLWPLVRAAQRAPGPILDPFAGVGGIHQIGHAAGRVTVGVEIEPEWAIQHRGNVVGDATALPFPDDSIGCILTSPTYGNDLAAKGGVDGGDRRSYRTFIGRELHPSNTGQHGWGRRYRTLHEAAWLEAVRVLRADGRVIVNCSDFVRDGTVIAVTAWHVRMLERLGFDVVSWEIIETGRYGHGVTADARTPGEDVVVLARRPVGQAAPRDAVAATMPRNDTSSSIAEVEKTWSQNRLPVISFFASS